MSKKNHPYLTAPHLCDCGRPATHRDGSGWECDRCRLLNLKYWQHSIDRHDKTEAALAVDEELQAL